MKLSKSFIVVLQLSFLIFLLKTNVHGQQKREKEGDSLALDQTIMQLRKIDSIHREDSLRSIELQKEIEELKGTGLGAKRLALLKQLDEQKQQDSLRKREQTSLINKLKLGNVGFAVSPFVDTLFMIHTRVGSFSPKDRAMSISNRIVKLYDDYEFNPDSLKISLGETSSEIVYKDQVIMSVNELEALWFGMKASDLSRDYRDRIHNAIRTERQGNSIKNILFRAGTVLMIIVGCFIVIVLINRVFRGIRKRTIALKGKFLNGIRIRNYQLLDSGRELEVILFLTNLFRLFIIAIALYIALPLVFSVFPWTQGFADKLIGWILSPVKSMVHGLISYLPNLFTIVVIAFITRYVSKFLQFIAGEIEAGVLTIPGFYADWARPTMNIIKFLLYAFSFIIIFPYLPGSESPIFQGVSVFVGILFSLGSSSAISNAVAGLVITYMRPFKVGDRIKIGELSGDVVEKNLLVTRIRTIKNEDITVPNASILSGHTINYTTSAKELGLILHTTVTIGYDVPWKQVHDLLLNAGSNTKGLSEKEDQQPFILQTSLDDFYVSYQLNVYTDQSHQMARIYSELHQHIQDCFNEAGVEIMSPHYRAARDGNMSTIPSSYLKENYMPPSFKVNIEDKGNLKDDKKDAKS